MATIVFGKQFESINQENFANIIREKLDLSRTIKRSPEYQQIWQAFHNKHKELTKNYAYFPLACGITDYLVALDRKTGIMMDAIPINFLNTIKKKYLSLEEQQAGIKFW